MKAKIKDIKQETHDTKRFTITLEKEIEHKPGQFIKLTLPKKYIGRPFSISSKGGKHKEIELTIKLYADGNFTQKLNELKKGDEVEIDGPYGHFYFDDKTKKDVVLIAGGTGISALHSIFRYIIDKKLKNKITLFYSAKKEEDLVYKEEFEKEDIKLHINLTREKNGRRLNKEDLKNVNKDSLFFIVGPNEFVKDIAEILKNLKIKEENIKTEIYGR